MANILLIDDDLIYLDELSDGLRSLNHHVNCAASIDEAKQSYEKEAFDIIICDTIMEGGGALSFLHYIREFDSKISFVAITGRAEIASSPLFLSGMSEAHAKIEKTATLFEIDHLVRSLLR